MKKKYHILIILGLLFVAVTTISFWGDWGVIIVMTVVACIFSRFGLPFFLLIFWGKPKKEIKKSDTKKPPKKMKYLYWSKDDSGRPFAKAIGEQEQKNEKNPGKTKQ